MMKDQIVIEKAREAARTAVRSLKQDNKQMTDTSCIRIITSDSALRWGLRKLGKSDISLG
ncbi:MAG: hypothetical protein AAF984_08045 [Verrucomicrobiota bacterium]